MASFTSFPRLPAEIRQQIWLLSVSEDEAEICLPWPINVPMSMKGSKEPLYKLPCHPMTVDLPFPVAMHVCRESRHTIQDNPRSTGVRFRASHAAGCPTPFRLFRPDLDVLFLGDGGLYFMELLTTRVDTVFDTYHAPSDAHLQERKRLLEEVLETLRQTRRFAVAAPSMPGQGLMVKHFFVELWTACDVPEANRWELCYVVPTTKNLYEMDPDRVWLDFVPPGKRCRLATIDKCIWGTLLVPTDTIRSKPLRTLEELVVKVGEEIRTTDTSHPLWFHPKVTKLEFTDLVDVTAATFEEYQHDGTWIEACADRMYRDDMMLIEIPPDERPDPQLQRVYDADIELRLIRWDVSDSNEE